MPEGSVERLNRVLSRWGSSAQVEARLGGGNRNEVYAVRIRGNRYAARLTDRQEDAVNWELDLLYYLADIPVDLSGTFRRRSTGEGQSCSERVGSGQRLAEGAGVRTPRLERLNRAAG